MTHRFGLVTMVLIGLLLLPGCPAQGLGVWGFLPDGVGDPRGLELQANGDAVQVPLSNVNFAGTLTWERISDTEILLRQTSQQTEKWVFVFNLTSDTTMSGGSVKIEGLNAGLGQLWTAVKQ